MTEGSKALAREGPRSPAVPDSGERGVTSGFFLWSLGWCMGLVILGQLFQIMNWPASLRDFTAGERFLHLLRQVPGHVGLFLPFTAFAGGVAVQRFRTPRFVVSRALVLSVAAYGLLAYAVPVLDYHREAREGLDVEARDPWGPTAPTALLAQRTHVLANPPERYSLRVDEPYRRPPSYLLYQVHALVVHSLFAVFSALLGFRVAQLTSGLSFLTRRNARWSLGLVVALTFFLPVMAAGAWVREDWTRPGLPAAWGPLLVPALALGVASVWVRIRQRPRRRLAEEV